MFERNRFGWLLGRPALSGGVVGWVGIVALPDFIAIVKADDLDVIFRERDIECISAFGCTSSENLIAALKPDMARRVAPKIIDLSLAIRVASMRGEPERSPQRTIDLLVECMNAEHRGPVPELLGSLLEGRVSDIGDLGEVDSMLKSLLRCVAQRLRKAGELRRYIRYELPVHRVLLAQSKFRLLSDLESLTPVVDDLSVTLRLDRMELITKYALDPVDFIASFEARQKFANQHLCVSGSRLTLKEFRELLDEFDRPVRADQTASLVASFLRRDASRRAMLTLVTTDGAGCQVMYDSIGTSTGRVVMRSPGVQWLEKKYRKYILPPEGYALRYLDYSCFEPTILAAVSADVELLAACASDVYERVGEWLGFDGAAARNLAKAILLRFIYGQAQDKIIATLSAEALLEPEDARSRIESLGRRLSRAFEFRSELEARARMTGYMETQVGNRCLVEEGGAFKVLSHFLQGTGALIFKRALVEIFGGASVARLIVPMHDAFLCAFPMESLESCSQQAVAAMQACFLEVVGVDLARVSVSREF